MHVMTNISMAVTTARVGPGVAIPWMILSLAMRTEYDEIVPQLETLTAQMIALLEEIAGARRIAEGLLDQITPILQEADAERKSLLPLWDDVYSLCGDPTCHGECRVCQEGEEDYEDSYTEKYCRRGKR